MSEEQALKAFLNETRERANTVLQEEHIGADVKNVLRDLLKVSDSFHQLMQQSTGQSADTRVLKKKLDQSKAETRAVQAKLDGSKAMVVALTDEIKKVSSEAVQIAKRHEATPDDPDAQGAGRIRSALQKMVSLIVQI